MSEERMRSGCVMDVDEQWMEVGEDGVQLLCLRTCVETSQYREDEQGPLTSMKHDEGGMQPLPTRHCTPAQPLQWCINCMAKLVGCS
eukprot:1004324-Pelagomonas_calceolata.AAC.2